MTTADWYTLVHVWRMFCIVGPGACWPAGTTIFVTPTALHRNRAYWGDDADAFRPERWLEKEAGNPPGSAYFWPFGRGPRECLGKYWALFYATVYTRTPAHATALTDAVRAHASIPLLTRLVFRRVIPAFRSIGNERLW